MRRKVIAAIDPDKDVDGFHVINAGRLAVGQSGFVPCTPLGCMMLLTERLGDLSGKEAVVIGRSNIVGKPMAMLLLDANATVTIAHSRTKDLPEVVRRADIVVAAVGRPEMVRGDWLKPGATVIDVGINRLNPQRGAERGRLVGDVAYDEALEVAGAITPVPGGVGPMTIAVLLQEHAGRGLPQCGIWKSAGGAMRLLVLAIALAILTACVPAGSIPRDRIDRALERAPGAAQPSRVVAAEIARSQSARQERAMDRFSRKRCARRTCPHRRGTG